MTGALIHRRAGSDGRRLLTLAALGVFFALALLGSGQISAGLGLLLLVLTLGALAGRLRQVLAGIVGFGTLALAALQPVIAARLDHLDPATGLPRSWTGEYGRLANIQTHVLPRLGEGANWLLGVQPAARIEATEQWRHHIYIESGYLWLLWTGGLPLLLCFAAFVVVMWRTGSEHTEHPSVPLLTGVALRALAVVYAVLMLLDPHLTIRGGSDLLFPVLALAASGTSWTPHPREGDAHALPTPRAHPAREPAAGP